MALPHDICRCQGIGCTLRDTCQRHTCADTGPRTPFMAVSPCYRTSPIVHCGDRILSPAGQAVADVPKTAVGGA